MAAALGWLVRPVLYWLSPVGGQVSQSDCKQQRKTTGGRIRRACMRTRGSVCWDWEAFERTDAAGVLLQPAGRRPAAALATPAAAMDASRAARGRKGGAPGSVVEAPKGSAFGLQSVGACLPPCSLTQALADGAAGCFLLCAALRVVIDWIDPNSSIFIHLLN